MSRSNDGLRIGRSVLVCKRRSRLVERVPVGASRNSRSWTCPACVGPRAGHVQYTKGHAARHWVGATSAQIPSLADRVGDRAGYEASSNQSSACGGARGREGRRGARQAEHREQGARDGGVDDDGNHAAPAAARARKHVGGEH